MSQYIIGTILNGRLDIKIYSENNELKFTSDIPEGGEPLALLKRLFKLREYGLMERDIYANDTLYDILEKNKWFLEANDINLNKLDK